jgi:ADP-ribose pyrophosphatase
MSPERTVRSERIYEGKIINLRVDTVELPSGKKTKREIVEHAACTAIVAIDSENNVLLVRQYRKAAERMLLEIPAGGIEPGEKPLDGARRELEEETGFSAELLLHQPGLHYRVHVPLSRDRTQTFEKGRRR